MCTKPFPLLLLSAFEWGIYSQCTYVRTYVSVTLRNVHLHSFALTCTLRNSCVMCTDNGGREQRRAVRLDDGGRRGQHAWTVWWLLDPVSSSFSLSVVLSALETSHTTRTELPLGWWLSSKIICTRVCTGIPPIATIRGRCLFCLEFPIGRLIFEGGVYSRKYGMRSAQLLIYCPFHHFR